MEENTKNKLYEMLKHMSNYSIEQPKSIEVLCKELYISPAYAPVMDLMVEAFLTIRSFVVLMFEGLISNASAILRILIEQVSTLTVITNNPNIMSEYLKFQTRKKQYYGSVGEEHNKIRKFLLKEIKLNSEGAIKDYLDYGWIRIINDDKSERGNRIIIKEARLEEMINDINQQLNAFAHGQRSIFEFQKNNLADKHIARIIMMAGKLFLFLCHAKHELLVNDEMSTDKFFESYINAKILYTDLNSRFVNERIVDFIEQSNDLDRDIAYLMSSILHCRGLIYDANLNYVQVNTLARAYVFQLINISYMLFYKTNSNVAPHKKCSFKDLINIFGIDEVKKYWDSSQNIPFEDFANFVDMIDDKWGFMNSEGVIENKDEFFITSFTSFVFTVFERIYPDYSVEELIKMFVPIE